MKNRILKLALVPLLSLAAITIIQAKSKPSPVVPQSSSNATQQNTQSASAQNAAQANLQQYKRCQTEGEVAVVNRFQQNPNISIAFTCVSIEKIITKASQAKAEAPDLVFGSCPSRKTKTPSIECFNVNCEGYDYHFYSRITNPAVKTPKCPTLKGVASK